MRMMRIGLQPIDQVYVEGESYVYVEGESYEGQ